MGWESLPVESLKPVALNIHSCVASPSVVSSSKVEVDQKVDEEFCSPWVSPWPVYLPPPSSRARQK